MADEKALTTTREELRQLPGLVPVAEKEMIYALRWASTLIRSGLLPQTIKTPQQAVLIMLFGRELGVPPVRALQHIYVIDGRPSASAELQLALFRESGGTIKVLESTAKVARVSFRASDGMEHTETVTWEDMARVTRKGKKLIEGDNWQNYPRLMLRWRCVLNGLRIVASHVLAGLRGAWEHAVSDHVAGEWSEVEGERGALLEEAAALGPGDSEPLSAVFDKSHPDYSEGRAKAVAAELREFLADQGLEWEDGHKIIGAASFTKVDLTVEGFKAEVRRWKAEALGESELEPGAPNGAEEDAEAEVAMTGRLL